MNDIYEEVVGLLHYCEVNWNRYWIDPAWCETQYRSEYHVKPVSAKGGYYEWKYLSIVAAVGCLDSGLL